MPSHRRPRLIKDAKALTGIRNSWRTVRLLQASIQATFSRGVVSTGRMPESLLLVFALSVLEDTLGQFHHEGAFVCRGRRLRDLMQASRRVLPWRDYPAVEAIRDRRDAIAHRAQLLDPGQYASDLEAIARELIDWRVLEAPDS